MVFTFSKALIVALLSSFPIGAMAEARPASARVEPVLTFSAHPELRRMTIRVDVGMLAPGEAGGGYWFRKTLQPDRGDVVETVWADTRTCPGGHVALEALAALEGPRPRVEGLTDTDVIAVADGTTYRIDVATERPFARRMTLATNTGTPLARWVEGALEKLRACWTSTPPSLSAR